MRQLLVFFMFIPLLPAHGVQQHLLQGGYGIQINYDNGDPMDFADVQVFRPGDTDLPEFQTGATDERGIFMFKPDTIGIWTVKVSDGLGHGAVISVPVETDQKPVASSNSLSRGQKLISGIGYILFFFSLWYAVLRRRQASRAHS